MTPCSATKVWCALLVNASLRLSVVACSSTRNMRQPAAFIGTAISSSRRGARSFVSGRAVGGDGKRAVVGLGQGGSWSPSCSTLTAVNINPGGGLWVQHRHQPRSASRDRRHAARVSKGRVREGVVRGLSAGATAAAAESSSVGAAADGGVGGKAASSEALKVTVLSGFLGAGKTTLMRNVLRQAEEERLSLAVIVNDMADVNVDAQLLARGRNEEEPGGNLVAAAAAAPAAATGVGSASSSSSEDAIVAMHDGCICCTLKEDLLREVEAIARGGKHQHLIIESTGISDPFPVAEALVGSEFGSDNSDNSWFADDDNDGEDSESNARVATAEREKAENQVGEGEGQGQGAMFSLDTLVTVVDSTTFLDEVRKADELEERGMEAEEGDTRTIADLLISQVEFANVILLNKADLAAETDLATLEGVVRGLNPEARIVRTISSDVGLPEVLGTGEFDLDEASQAAGWVKALNDNEDHDDDDHDHHHHHGPRQFGIGSFTFRERRPFHPERLMGFVMEHLPSVLRSKGFLWLATRNDEAGVWNQSGGSFATEYGGLWDDEEEEVSGDGINAGDNGGERAGCGQKEGATGPGEGHATSQSAVVSVGGGAGNSEVDDDDDGHAGSNARLNELVFIGLGMDDDALKAELQRCLLTDEEMAVGPEGWQERFADPFPPWQ